MPALSIAGQMAAARDDLTTAIDELTLTTKRRVPSDLDPGRLALVEPLLVAVEESRGLRPIWLGRRASRNNRQPPVRLSVTQLLDDVDRVVGRPVGSQAASRRTARVRAWSADMLSSPSCEALTQAAQLAAHWVEVGTAFFAATRWLGLRDAPCPACESTHARASDGAGGFELSEALVADLQTGEVFCTIAGCETVWSADHLELLARALDVQTATEVLAVDPAG